MWYRFLKEGRKVVIEVLERLLFSETRGLCSYIHCVFARRRRCCCCCCVGEPWFQARSKHCFLLTRDSARWAWVANDDRRRSPFVSPSWQCEESTRRPNKNFENGGEVGPFESTKFRVEAPRNGVNFIAQDPARRQYRQKHHEADSKSSGNTSECLQVMFRVL